MLPDGSGLAYLKELRQATDIPVIVLTALEDEYTQIQTFDLKADEYVDKPVSPVVMTKRISALFERVYNKRTLTPICGNQFNFSGLSVHTNRGEEILLTATEMQIIQCLYKNNGITVSRKKLMELIWGFEYIDDDRLLDSHIKNLRQKLVLVAAILPGIICWQAHYIRQLEKKWIILKIYEYSSAKVPAFR